MMLLKRDVTDTAFQIADDDQIHFLALVADLQRCLLVQIGHFHPEAGSGDLQFSVVRRYLLSFDLEIMQTVPFPLEHSDEEPDLQDTDRNREITEDEPRDGDSFTAK